MCIFRVFQEVSAIVWENIPWVSLHKYSCVWSWTVTSVNDVRRMWSCSSVYCVVNMMCYLYTAQVCPFAHSQAQSHRSMLCKVLGTLRTIFMRQFHVFLNQCPYVILMLIRCYVQVLTSQELQISLHFNMYLIMNKCLTNLMEHVTVCTAQSRKNAKFSVKHNMYFIQRYKLCVRLINWSIIRPCTRYTARIK